MSPTRTVTLFQDDQSLQFQTGLKVINNQVWTVSNLLHKYINGNMPVNKVTQRINVGRVADLLRDTKCQTRQRPWTSQSTSLVFPSKRATTRPWWLLHGPTLDQSIEPNQNPVSFRTFVFTPHYQFKNVVEMNNGHRKHFNYLKVNY